MPNGRASAAQRVSKSAWVLAALCACHPTPDVTPPARSPSAAQGEPAPSTAPPSTAPPASDASAEAPAAAAAAPAGSTPIEGEDEYLVETPSHELVLRTRERVVRVLAKDVYNAIYDPNLELVWVEGEALRVVDLRKPNSKPITIVRKWPGSSSLTISHPATMVSTTGACDVGDLANLHWEAEPTLRVIADEDRLLPLESKAWLKAELTRPPRQVPDPLATSIRSAESHVALPPKLAHCQDPDDCGRAVRFGAYDLELVLSVTMPGECDSPYCVLHDRKSGAFSSPTPGKRWKGAGGRGGSCGLYYFDRSGKSFLEGDRVCGAGERCQGAGGYAIGWRVPGVVVGATGGGSIAPDAAELEKLDAERKREREGEGEGEDEQGEGE